MANCLPFLFSFSNAVLLWLLVAVSVKLGRPHIGRNALELMEQRLAKDDFP
jgi:hypothetical protein